MELHSWSQRCFQKRTITPVLVVVKLIKLRILTCKIVLTSLWCWISDAWAAVFKMTSDGLNQTLSSDKLQHEQRRASATSHCKLNWSVGKHSIPYKAYTQTILHRAQQTDIWQSTCNVSAGMHVQMNVLNSVPAVHTYNISYGTTVWTILQFKKCNGTAGIFKL